MVLVASAFQAVAVAAASIGDATIGALIGGVFLLLNTVFTYLITRHHDHAAAHTPPPENPDSSPGNNRPGSSNGNDLQH